VADKLLHVRVVSPDRIVFDGEGSAVVAPAWDGQVGILPGHAPMLALVGSGVLSVERVGGGSDAFHVAGGVLKVERNQVTVLTEYAGDAPPPKPLRYTVVDPEDAAALA
jgi:F-type H+-transporting ATPase subunit epsilon